MPPLVGGGILKGVIDPDELEGGDPGDGGELATFFRRIENRKKIRIKFWLVFLSKTIYIKINEVLNCIRKFSKFLMLIER